MFRQSSSQIFCPAFGKQWKSLQKFQFSSTVDEIERLSAALRSKRTKDLLSIKGHDEVVHVKQDDTVFHAINKMVDKKIGAVMVETEKHKFCGIMTERDYLTKVIVKGRRSTETKVKDIMTTKIFPAITDWTMEDCMHCMADNYIRHIPIYEFEGKEIQSLKSVGMLSSRDVLTGLKEVLSSMPNPPSLGNVEDIFLKLAQNTTPKFSVTVDSTVFDAVQKMVDNRLGGVFIQDGTKLVGIFTERDYLSKIALKGRFSKEFPVSEVMTKDLIQISPNMTIESCIDNMLKNHIRHVPIANLVGNDISYSEKEDSHIGLINMLDIIRYISKITR